MSLTADQPFFDHLFLQGIAGVAPLGVVAAVHAAIAARHREDRLAELAARSWLVLSVCSCGLWLHDARMCAGWCGAVETRIADVAGNMFPLAFGFACLASGGLAAAVIRRSGDAPRPAAPDEAVRR